MTQRRAQYYNVVDTNTDGGRGRGHPPSLVFGGIHHEHSERVSKRPDGARGPAESAEPEFHQAVQEVLTSLVPVVEAKPEYIKEGVMDCLVEPERIIKFRVLGG